MTPRFPQCLSLLGTGLFEKGLYAVACEVNAALITPTQPAEAVGKMQHQGQPHVEVGVVGGIGNLEPLDKLVDVLWVWPRCGQA